MSIAELILYCMGLKSKIPWKRTLNCQLWSLFKQGLINFQHAAAKGIKQAARLVLNALKESKIIGEF